jgi:large repetitive protein
VIVNYAWNFGDGTTASGKTIAHTYQQGGEYLVTLTVTDDRGLSASVTSAVTVRAATAPTASFVFSPSTPEVGQEVYFNASSSQPGAGHTIVSYEWTMGSDSTRTGITVSKHYNEVGTYAVTLVVTDEVGQKGTITNNVPVTFPDAPQAAFDFSPASPTVNQQILFNAARSSAAPGHWIVSYEWNMGSGNPRTGRTVSKAYDVAGTYTVTLVVTDDLGQQGSVAQSVTIVGSGPGGPVARFSFSPTEPTAGVTTVYFDAAESSSPYGVANYEWDFGDGSRASRVNAQHLFATAGNYVVRLTITDNAGYTATTTQEVTAK